MNIRFHTCVTKRICKLQLHMAGEAQYLFGDFLLECILEYVGIIGIQLQYCVSFCYATK